MPQSYTQTHIKKINVYKNCRDLSKIYHFISLCSVKVTFLVLTMHYSHIKCHLQGNWGMGTWDLSMYSIFAISYKAVIISNLKVKKKKKTNGAPSAWRFLGLWSLFLDLSGRWRVCPNKETMVLGSRKPTPETTLQHQGEVWGPRGSQGKRFFWDPLICNGKNSSSPSIVSLGSQGQLFQRYLFGSRSPSFSLCLSHFLTRPPATLSSFQSACNIHQNMDIQGKEGDHAAFVKPDKKRGLFEWPLGNWKGRAQSGDSGSVLQASGHPILIRPLEPLLSFGVAFKFSWNYFVFYEQTSSVENFFLPKI